MSHNLSFTSENCILISPSSYGSITMQNYMQLQALMMFARLMEL